MREVVAIQLGPFTMEAPVGEGGSGAVWRGRHTSGVPVAIKVLHRENAWRREALDAFASEVRAVAGLEHPHIIRVLDHGVVEGGSPALRGSPYLVMEYLPETLGSWLTGIEWEPILSVLQGLLDALAHAHARGVLHRDLKLSNVLLSDGGRVRLADFGLAYLRQGDGEVPFAHQGGTPSYMAPEQIRGEWRDWGPPTDLYALGCLTWRLVTGRGPFTRPRDPRRTLKNHLEKPIPRLNPRIEVPAGLRGWLERLLQKHPDDRFQGAADAAWALSRLGPVDRRKRPVPRPPSPALGEATTRVLGPVIRQETEPTRSGAAPADAPPMPADWRRGERVHRVQDLHGAGLGLYGLRTVPLVDRETERDALWSALIGVRASREPAAIVLRGASGLGKSRLARWLCERASETGAANVLHAQHTPSSGPRDGLRGMVERHLGCTGLDEDERTARVSAIFPGSRLDAALADAWLSGDWHGERATRHALISRILARHARDRPVVLWLDDVQWGPDAIAFAHRLLDESVPVAILLTVQDEAVTDEPTRQALAALTAHDRSRELSIGPLRAFEHAALVRELLGLHGRLAARVEERTAGNPQFAIQLVGDWVSRGILELSEDGFGLAPGAEIELPESLGAVWSARIDGELDGRPPDDGLAMELAAVLGQEVVHDDWIAVCAAASCTPSPDLVASWMRRRLLVELPGGDGWRFAHGVLREALLQRASSADRRVRHHAACAETLDSAGPERVGRHLAGSRQWAQAAPRLLEAARDRIDGDDFRMALALLDEWEDAMGRAGLPASDPMWGVGWAKRGHLQLVAGNTEDAARTLDRADRAARAHGWNECLPELLLERAVLLRGRMELEAAVPLLMEGEALAEQTGSIRNRAAIAYQLGWIQDLQGDSAAATAHFELSARLFDEVGDVSGVSVSLRGLATTAFRSGDTAAAEAYANRALELAPHQAGPAAAHVQLVLGEIAKYRGDLDAAADAYGRAHDQFRWAGSRDAALAELNLGTVRMTQERWTEAQATLHRCLADFLRRGNPHFEAAARLTLMVCAAATGDFAEWDEHAFRCERGLEETRFVDPDCARWARKAAELAEAQGETLRARRARRIAAAQLRALGRTDEADAVVG